MAVVAVVTVVVAVMMLMVLGVKKRSLPAMILLAKSLAPDV